MAPRARAVPLASLPDVPVPRIKLFPSLDYVLGGGSEEENGCACSTVVQLAGDPGAGKSTLLLQTLAEAAKRGPVVYGVGEEGGAAIRNRATRVGCFAGETGAAVSENLLLLETRIFEDFLDECRQVRPVLAIFDSEQIAQSRVVMHPPRSAAMVTYVTEQAFRMAHDPAMGGIVIFLICQIVKDGTAAGPKATEHWIDASVYLDTQQGSDMRTLSSTKNRNGPGMRQALLTMTPLGLVPWEDKHPDRVKHVEGSLTGPAEGPYPEGGSEVTQDPVGAACKDSAPSGPTEPLASSEPSHGPLVLPEQRAEERPGDLHHKDGSQ